MCGRLQLTLAILKPDVTSRPHIIKEIHNVIKKNNFYFVKSKHTHLPRNKVEEFYKEHEGRFFHGRLVNFMSSGFIWAHVLAHENAVQLWRHLMGPTKVFKTIHEHPGTIRGQFGLTDTRNATHGSDSVANALTEIAFFFPEFNAEQWFKEEEIYFRRGHVKYCDKTLTHYACKKLDINQ